MINIFQFETFFDFRNFMSNSGNLNIGDVLGGDARVEIDQADIPFQVRFNHGGTRAGAGRDGRDIRIIDTVTQEAHTLRVTAAGFATLDVRD